MSYILDALQKSEQQRQHGVSPRLLTVQTTAMANTRPALLTYGLFAAALIGAGVAIGLLHPWQLELQTSVTEPIAVEPIESRPRPSLAVPLPVPAAKSSSTIVKQDQPLAAQIPQQPHNLPHKTAALPKQTATPVRENTPAPKKISAPLQEADTTDSPLQQKVLAIAELPLAIQREIPLMSIQVHSYSSTPRERIVGINDRLLQEGDTLAPGLKLEQITPDGMIFSYKKYLFRHGL